MKALLAAPYDDRSIRAHVHRTRELLSLSTLHASLSTSLALEYENKASSSGGLQSSYFSSFLLCQHLLLFWKMFM